MSLPRNSIVENLTRWSGRRGSDHSKPRPYRSHRADGCSRAVRGGFPRRTPRGTTSPFRTRGLSGLATGAGTDRSVSLRALARERHRFPGVGQGARPLGRAGGDLLRRDRGPAGLSAARAAARRPSPRSPRPRGQGGNGGRAAPGGHRYLRARPGPDLAGCEALDRRNPRRVRVSPGLMEKLRRQGVRWSALEPVSLVALLASPRLGRARSRWGRLLPPATPVWIRRNK